MSHFYQVTDFGSLFFLSEVYTLYIFYEFHISGMTTGIVKSKLSGLIQKWVLMIWNLIKKHRNEIRNVFPFKADGAYQGLQQIVYTSLCCQDIPFLQITDL